MQGRWSGLPEWLRWVLFLPLLFGALLVAQLVLPFLLGGAVPEPGWRWARVLWAKILIPIVVASVIAPLSFELVYLLAPRGRRFLLWLAYIPATTWCGLALVILLARRLGSWGLLGERMLPYEGQVGWEAANWGELGQSVVWLVVGTASFRSCLQRARRERPASTNSAPPDGTITATRLP